MFKTTSMNWFTFMVCRQQTKWVIGLHRDITKALNIQCFLSIIVFKEPPLYLPLSLFHISDNSLNTCLNTP